MKNIFTLVLALLCSVIFTQSYAILDLELTQGVAASVPLVVVPFTGAKVQVPGNQTLAQIIDNDLQNSGEFRVINQNKSQNILGGNLNATQWRLQGADYILTGSVEATATQGYLVHFQLKSLFDSKANSKVKNGDALLNETYSSPAQSLRNLAHHISDQVYKKLTGTQGIFSTRIAYILVKHPTRNVSHYLLVVADADGFNPQTLLSSNQPIMSPAWSPDGNNIAYVSFEGHRAAIYLQNLASGKRRLISKTPGINGAPAFSPDGKKLALVLTKTDNPKIYLLDIGSKQLRQISSGWSIDTEPAFSADGSSLLFTSNRDGSPQIYQYSIPTGTTSRLTYNGKYNARALYTPDGKSIVMMHRQDGNYGIARMDFGSGTLFALTQAGADESPSLAPNGKMVIYATQYAGRGVLAEVSIDGRIKLRLPAREGTVQEPAWSPFLT